MGIDIYARWNEQTESEKEAQMSVWLSATAGDAGYLREAYHGEPYATQHLCAEAFLSPEREARIPAAVLRDRLPETLTLIEERERKIYGVTDRAEIDSVKQSFRNFVALCERKEKETGEPVVIVASF